MINHLKYKVTFPSTLRSLEREVDFTKGLTAITGPNEAGKSFVIEMIRFCLFGTKALRGERDDYDTLETAMEWRMRGKTYRVEREIDKAKLFEDGTPIAVGVKPVNLKIQSIMGYDLDVFDVAHVTNQGQVEALSAMKPSERKLMVDKTIGVDRIDDVTKWCSEQGTLLSREIEVLERGLVEPVEPVKPEDYEVSTLLAGAVSEMRGIDAQCQELRGWLSHTKSLPVLPERPHNDWSIDQLQKLVDDIMDRDAQKRQIEAMPIVDFDVDAVRDAWDQYDLWCRRERFIKDHPRPTMTAEQIAADREILSDRKELDALYERKEQLEKSPKAHCPNCGHDHFIAEAVGTQLADIEAKIEDLCFTPTHPIDPRVLDEEERRLRDWCDSKTFAEWNAVRDGIKTTEPTITRQQLRDATDGLTSEERARRLAVLPVFDMDRVTASKMMEDLRHWQAQVQVYDQQLAAYQAWILERDKKQAQLDQLQPLTTGLADTERRLREALTYETTKTRYLMDKEAYDSRLAEVVAKREEHAGWKEARAFLVELRSRIKSYLTPSLSRVASHLLVQMTGGQRQSIVIDDDFEIAVDGQKLNTLSGSGKACANLALRIGLGQVLTNNVLSLFIGDEIDASMDDDRAEYTHVSLQSLSERISQILLITHKVPSADHIVSFEGAGNGRATHSIGASVE